MTRHLVNHIHNPELTSDNTLHVVMVTSNVESYHSRYRLARECIERLQDTKNVRLHVVEAAHGDRQHELEESKHGLRLRVHSNAWVKENLINLGVRYCVPREAKYISWVDGDIEFRDPHWAQAALHQLQHFAIIQPWQSCTDLRPHGGVSALHTSFGYTDQIGTRAKHGPGGYTYGHTGYAWACTRAFWEQVGGLVDFCILGSGDHHMALACVGEVDRTVHTKMIAPFFRKLHEWQDKAVRVSHREVGFSVGRIEHHFHGSKSRRYYKERWQILVDAGFNPDTDLMHDDQGVIHIVGKPRLEQAIRKYNRSRLEDNCDE